MIRWRNFKIAGWTTNVNNFEEIVAKKEGSFKFRLDDLFVQIDGAHLFCFGNPLGI